MANKYPILYEDLQKNDAKMLKEALQSAGYDADMAYMKLDGTFSYNVWCWGPL